MKLSIRAELLLVVEGVVEMKKRTPFTLIFLLMGISLVDCNRLNHASSTEQALMEIEVEYRYFAPGQIQVLNEQGDVILERTGLRLKERLPNRMCAR